MLGVWRTWKVMLKAVEKEGKDKRKEKESRVC